MQEHTNVSSKLLFRTWFKKAWKFLVGIHSLDAVLHCNDFNTKIQTNLNELEVRDLMAMSLLKKIDDYSVGGLNIDSSNILLNMGKPHETGMQNL